MAAPPVGLRYWGLAARRSAAGAGGICPPRSLASQPLTPVFSGVSRGALQRLCFLSLHPIRHHTGRSCSAIFRRDNRKEDEFSVTGDSALVRAFRFVPSWRVHNCAPYNAAAMAGLGGSRILESVSDTELLVAHHRAMGSARPDALFHDPYAECLAGNRGAPGTSSITRASRPVGRGHSARATRASRWRATG
jgi:hypothetical protein